MNLKKFLKILVLTPVSFKRSECHMTCEMSLFLSTPVNVINVKKILVTMTQFSRSPPDLDCKHEPCLQSICKTSWQILTKFACLHPWERDK